MPSTVEYLTGFIWFIKSHRSTQRLYTFNGNKKRAVFEPRTVFKFLIVNPKNIHDDTQIRCVGIAISRADIVCLDVSEELYYSAEYIIYVRE